MHGVSFDADEALGAAAAIRNRFAFILALLTVPIEMARHRVSRLTRISAVLIDSSQSSAGFSFRHGLAPGGQN